MIVTVPHPYTGLSGFEHFCSYIDSQISRKTGWVSEFWRAFMRYIRCHVVKYLRLR